jgi:hypothetical protein
MPAFTAHSARAPLAVAAAALVLLIAACGSGSKSDKAHEPRASQRVPSVVPGLSPLPPLSKTVALGFSADSALTGGPPGDSVWIQRAVTEGVQIVRVNVYWARVAPLMLPPGFDASNPSSPYYHWSATDAAVRDLTAHGLKVLIDVLDAPTWAEGAGMPASEHPGTWQPDPAKFAAFATALARRYDGRYPDPENHRSALPKVQYWQPWNEPNLDISLSPQWVDGPNGWVDTSPVIYRRLLNSFYTAVKRVSPANFVISAGTAPYGDLPGQDPPGQERMPPISFYRDLFCLSDETAPCPGPVFLDAVDHHIYAIYGPLWHAANADDMATPDTYKLVAVLDAAQRASTVLPRGPKQEWVTEISWASAERPDRRHARIVAGSPEHAPTVGVSLDTQARWYEQAIYELWRQGVNTVLFFLIRDSDIPNFQATAGLYYLDGTPKPAATAFRFPFVTQRLGTDRVQLWGRSPLSGKLRIERLDGGAWTVIQTLAVRRNGLFVGAIALQGAATLRAQVGGQTSLPWAQGA